MSEIILTCRFRHAFCVVSPTMLLTAFTNSCSTVTWSTLERNEANPAMLLSVLYNWAKISTSLFSTTSATFIPSYHWLVITLAHRCVCCRRKKKTPSCSLLRLASRCNHIVCTLPLYTPDRIHTLSMQFRANILVRIVCSSMNRISGVILGQTWMGSLFLSEWVQ